VSGRTWRASAAARGWISCTRRAWFAAGRCCPARCLTTTCETPWCGAAHRAADGGYARQVDRAAGTAYGCFLALAALQDLAAPLPEADEVASCLAALASGDGAYANSRDLPIGSVPATAAAVTALHHLGRPATPEAPSWLLARHVATGGFVPVPGAPHADLLSTATALHALSLLGVDLSGIRKACLDFVRSLQRPGGGFAGHADDPAPDGDYTYYALLALGHLAA
jgi:hypothetical protein